METLKNSPAMKVISDMDVKLTDRFVSYLLQFATFKSLKIHCKFLEISCDGIAWLCTWVAFIWLINSKNLYQMQVNMLLGLLLDIVVVAVLKALVRRRRPAVVKDALVIGPDKFSFPSGHASRAFYILIFFTKLHTLPVVFWMPMTAWAVSVVISRLILKRHFILDVSAGALIGICEALFIGLIWISEETAASLLGLITEDESV
ncbi:PREDICTED: phospholipid phosphatase 6 [Drosophila arizonae]|uniref:Phospholipid phosphatase 6 n=1 Tax=Drosophila arizonae TaxID=7263 RepID=A0ABM1NSS8_DROAR|nr:PREDICTED: phospholipid phosphatase 6 [Drosophila arizonae]